MHEAAVRSSWLICRQGSATGNCWRFRPPPPASAEIAVACSNSPLSASFSARASSVASVVEYAACAQHGEVGLRRRVIGGEHEISVLHPAQREIERANAMVTGHRRGDPSRAAGSRPAGLDTPRADEAASRTA